MSIVPSSILSLLPSLSPSYSLLLSKSPSVILSISLLTLQSDLLTLSPSESLSIVLLLAPSLLTKEDYYLDKYYSSANLTELDKSGQAVYCESIISVVASVASNVVKVICKVFDQEVIDN